MENALLSNFHFFTEILRFPYIRVIFRKKMESSKKIDVIVILGKAVILSCFITYHQIPIPCPLFSPRF